MESIIDRSVEAYNQHKNLKRAAIDVGIPLSTLYCYLKRAGVSVCGDKSRYGSDTDRFAAKAEKEFMRIVPFAHNMNASQFQSKLDFTVGDWGVDVKASRLRSAGPTSKTTRWAFSIKKQEFVADFFVCFGFDEEGSKVEKILLVPGEVCRMYSAVSLSHQGGKWSDYEVTELELHEFFEQIADVTKA